MRKKVYARNNSPKVRPVVLWDNDSPFQKARIVPPKKGKGAYYRRKDDNNKRHGND